MSNQVPLFKPILKELSSPFLLFENIIQDRGSRYSVSGGHVENKEDIKAFLRKLKSDKRYLRATHNTWAARIEEENRTLDLKNDDGEKGAGMIILRQLQKSEMTNTLVVVTRWFGGEYLMGDRFRHVQEATKWFLEKALLSS